MSQKYVIGNYKLNPASQQDALTLAQNLTPSACVVGIAPSILHLSAIKSVLADGIALGVQDITHKSADVGAFTGDVSATQVKDMGANFTLVGHSERRQYHGETDEILSQKIAHAFHAGLSVVFCIGETKDDYDQKRTQQVLSAQLELLTPFAKQIPLDTDQTLPKLIIAYEPVWAIGTGLTPTLAEIECVHNFISETLSTLQIFAPILYGGSVNDQNATSFAQSPLIDGALVGGASLKTDRFAAIITAFS